jgi:hypothetical protein
LERAANSTGVSKLYRRQQALEKMIDFPEAVNIHARFIIYESTDKG